jgi:proliferating cell nuclear antigen
MTIIFKCKTTEGFLIKILAELLQNNIKTACFVISKDGISLRMMDHHKKILIDTNLYAENFSVYKFKLNAPRSIGLNLNHFYKMLKNIKKKDSIQLFINDDFPTDLGIKVIPKENNRTTTSTIKILNLQNLDIDIPGVLNGYGKCVIVSSSEYQKTIKDMNNIGNIINIVSKNFHIKFQCDAGGVLKRQVDFGEIEDSDNENTEDEKEYNQEFYTEQLVRISKISGLSTNIQIFATEGYPLLIRSSVGNIGKISIYIKSKELLEHENSYVQDSDIE